MKSLIFTLSLCVIANGYVTVHNSGSFHHDHSSGSRQRQFEPFDQRGVWTLTDNPSAILVDDGGVYINGRKVSDNSAADFGNRRRARGAGPFDGANAPPWTRRAPNLAINGSGLFVNGKKVSLSRILNIGSGRRARGVDPTARRGDIFFFRDATVPTMILNGSGIFVNLEKVPDAPIFPADSPNPHSEAGRMRREANSFPLWDTASVITVNASGVYINARKVSDSPILNVDIRRRARGVNPCLINNGIIEDCGVKRAETAEDRRMLNQYQEAIKQWHRDMNPPRKPKPKYPKFPPICRKVIWDS